MFTNPAFPALLKICLTFAAMLFCIHRRWQLWLVILCGGVLLAMLFGLSAPEIGRVAIGTLPQPSFLSLFGVVFCIMLLSEIQDRTGQGRRLVAGLAPYMRSPRLRLAFFPALVGLLPMPGGAIFSCPMIRDVAAGLDVTERRKVLINYWFRHIWESAWPLYPGYILTCILADIPPSMLWRYTFPIVFISVAVGCVFFLRAPVRPRPGAADAATEKRPIFSVLLEGLPIIIAIGTAPLYDGLFSLLGVTLPAGTSFVLAFLSASASAMLQNGLAPRALPELMAKRHVVRMLALVLAIFLFKELVIAARVVDALASVITGKSAILALFLFLPVVMGVLTGLMLGFVGSAFPLLLALMAQEGIYGERLCWILVAMIAGHVGQMISPLHGCYLVTLEFFKETLATTWRAAGSAALAQFVLSAAYVAGLYFLVHPLL